MHSYLYSSSGKGVMTSLLQHGRFLHSYSNRAFHSNTILKVQEKDTICELASSNIRWGVGGSAEVGQDLEGILKNSKGNKKVAVFTDKNVKKLPCMQVVMDSLERSGIQCTIYDAVRVEPNDASFRHAASSLTEEYGAIVALGGGSVIDTAKAANLYSCYPPNDFYDYVNPPLGKGMPVPGPLLPLIAIPTTAGTGSETTGVAIFDDIPSQSKTGIANRKLKPTLGIVDPNNTQTLPKDVAKYSGLDVLCHAIESYTALSFDQRDRPESPLHRPAYQGSNPISDIWSLHALRLTCDYIERAVSDNDDFEARSNMLLASTAAGIGFGNAGVHLCHGMSYSVASQVKSHVKPPQNGYEQLDHAIVPHGLSVIINAPAVFRFTGAKAESACPERHLECAKILAQARNRPFHWKSKDAAGEILAEEILDLMSALDVPMGLRSLEYNESDIDKLVTGTLPQHRVTKISPRPVTKENLNSLFIDALDY